MKCDVFLAQLLESWRIIDSELYQLESVLAWHKQRQAAIFVEIKPTTLASCKSWYYDSELGQIRHEKGAFFALAGLKGRFNGQELEQPIILQPEIGFLGLLAQVRQGVLYFLVQAKIEPGNINKVQLSPTIQATKSNFTQQHGGRAPYFLEYFRAAGHHTIIADQIHSEQSSRFYGKRNRNMIVLVSEQEKISEGDNFRWLTLGQIKRLMRFDNLVNMDLRTVIATLPFPLLKPAQLAAYRSYVSEPQLFTSLFLPQATGLGIQTVTNALNDYKMLNDNNLALCKLSELTSWQWEDDCFRASPAADFKLIFTSITIEGREVQSWAQPMVAAAGKALFALAYRETAERGWEFLVHIQPECGCFDSVELGPSVQLEHSQLQQEYAGWTGFLLRKIARGQDLKYAVALSEEGGRFYQEENDNYIIQVYDSELADLPLAEQGYFFLTWQELSTLNLVNNVLNIQLRNLLALLELNVASEQDFTQLGGKQSLA